MVFMNIDSAMVLCAGLGTRIRQVSADIPKPMIEVMGKSLIERTLEFACDGGISNFVINLHYKAEILKEHIKALPIAAKINIEFIYESILLETGGGTKNALSHFGSVPFFTFNSDQIWLTKAVDIMERMRKSWGDKKMQSLLLLAKKELAVGYFGRGDFELNEEGLLLREFANSDKTYPYIYTGLQLTSADFFENSPDGPFSFLYLFKQAEIDGVLKNIYGIMYDDHWADVGTPEGLQQAKLYLERNDTILVKDPFVD